MTLLFTEICTIIVFVCVLSVILNDVSPAYRLTLVPLGGIVFSYIFELIGGYLLTKYYDTFRTYCDGMRIK